MAKPLDVHRDTFDDEVINQDGPVLVDFWSPTCPHCLRLNPEYEQACEELADEVKLVKVSLPVGRELFQKHGVMGTPTMVLFNKGEEIARAVGAKESGEICSWVREQLQAA